MATCRFCQKEFVNAQAVRAHLKGCLPYLNRPPRQIPEAPSLGETSVRDDSLGTPNLGNASGESHDSPDVASDLVRQFGQRIAAERLRLQLRELEEAHGELDRRTEARQLQEQREIEKQAEARRLADQERDATRQREVQARQARESRANADEQKRHRRRGAIQEVKGEVVDRWPYGASISITLKAQILQEIERVLTPLPVDELPLDELVKIAQGTRDRLHGDAVRAEQHAQRQAQERQRLQQHGLDYAKHALRDVDDLDVLATWRIEQRVSRELAEIVGDESIAEIEDWVDDILDDEGIGFDEDDEDD